MRAAARATAAAARAAAGFRGARSLLRHSYPHLISTRVRFHAAASEPGAWPVTIQIPGRFCGLAIATAGGSADLDCQITEAPLEIRSRGGTIHAKRARATDAVLFSGGGRVECGELSASRVAVRSGGGGIDIKRLFGLDIEISSATAAAAGSNSNPGAAAGAAAAGRRSAAAGAPGGGIQTAGFGAGIQTGGDVRIGAAYGERAVFETGGGSFAAAHVSCSGLASVDTRGGGLCVEGLEGNASLLSGGGAVRVRGRVQTRARAGLGPAAAAAAGFWYHRPRCCSCAAHTLI